MSFNLNKFLELVAPGYNIKNKEELNMFFNERKINGRTVYTEIPHEEIFTNLFNKKVKIHVLKNKEKNFLFLDKNFVSCKNDMKTKDRETVYVVKDGNSFYRVKENEIFYQEIGNNQKKFLVVFTITNSKNGKTFKKFFTHEKIFKM